MSNQEYNIHIVPTLAHMNVPPPKSWDEFEEIVTSCLKIRWKTTQLQRNGRLGQQQHGVDIHGEDADGNSVGVQCKLTTSITMALVNADIANAEKFSPPRQILYFATTAPRDSAIQEKIRILSAKRVSKQLFQVEILFWDDLWQDLITNPVEFRKHYPELKLVTNDPDRLGARLLAILDLAFFGLNLEHFLELIFGEIGFHTQENPDQFEHLCLSIESCADTLFRKDPTTNIASLIQELRAFTSGSEITTWAPAYVLISQITGQIKSLEYRLSGLELAAFRAGTDLARWESRTPKSTHKLSNELQRRLKSSIRALSIQQELPEGLQPIFDKYNSTDSVSKLHTPETVYNIVRDLILFHELNTIGSD